MIARQGRQYHVKRVGLSATADILTNNLTDLGYGVTSHTSSNETTITAICPARWYSILLCPSPQRLYWHLSVSQNNENISLRFDQRFFKWYLVVLVLLSPFVGWLWITGFSNAFNAINDLNTLSMWTLILPVLGLVTMILFTRSVLASGNDLIIRLLENIRRDIRDTGGEFKRVDGFNIDGKVLSIGSLLAFLTISSLLSLLLSNSATSSIFEIRSTSSLLLRGLGLLCIIALSAAVRALYLAHKHRGVDDRFSPVAPAMFTMLALGFVLLSQMPFRLIGQADGELWVEIFTIRDALAQNSGKFVEIDGETILRDKLEHGLKIAKLVGCGLFLIAASLWASAFALILKSISAAQRMIDISRRIKNEINTDAGRATASGKGFLTSFRWTFGVIWVCYTIGLLVGVTALISLMGNIPSLSPQLEAVKQPLGVGEGFVNTLSLILGIHQESIFLRGFGILVWIGWPALMLGLIVASLWTYFRRRSRIGTGQSGKSMQNRVIEQTERLENIAKSLGQHANSSTLKIIVSETTNVPATSYFFPWNTQKCVIVISLNIAECLNNEEIRALIAHEFAHFICGHSVKHELMHILGRITLVGGAFVGALENSFGFEVEADRTAITQLGSTPSALRSCLLKLHATIILENACVSQAASHDGLQAVENTNHSNNEIIISRKLNLSNVIRNKIRNWLFFFDSSQAVSYWHPSLQDRLSALETSKLK